MRTGMSLIFETNFIYFDEQKESNTQIKSGER